MAMYGKSARRRIPEFSIAAMAQKSPMLEMFDLPEEVATPKAPAAIRSTTPTKLKAIVRTSPARSQASLASQNEDIFDVPESDEETPKKAPAPASKVKPKPKQVRQKQLAKSAAPISSFTTDVWDVPDDDKTLKIVRQRAATPTKPKPIEKKQAGKPASPTLSIWDNRALKTVRQRAPSPSALKPRAQKLPPASPVPSPKKIDVYDVPSDDGEKQPLSAKRKHQTMQQKSVTSNVLRTVEALQPAPERSNKKLRLSPVRDSPVSRVPVKTAVSQAPKAVLVAKLPPSRNQSPGRQTQMVARPKIQAPAKTAKKTEAIRAIRQVTPQPQRFRPAPSTPLVSLSDVEMLDAASAPSKQISPRGLKILQNLVESVDNSEEESAVDAAEKVGKNKVASGAFGGTLSRPAGITKSMQRSPKLLPRRRLIDTLVEQKQDSESESSDDFSDFMSDSFPASQQSVETREVPESQFASQMSSRPAMMTSESQMSQAGPRITYARAERSYLAEQDIMKDLEMGLPTQSSANAGPRRRGVSGLKSLASFHADDEDEEEIPAIRSVHELRLAGLNNRFMDNVQDCLGQIGTPGKTPAAKSARRGGLMDLANKMKDKSFLKQFRDNGIEQKLFLHLDQETDIVSGFLMISLLISVLSEGSMAHLDAQLQQHGITGLIIRLLDYQSGVVTIAKERKSNMSKVAQKLLAEHHDHLLQTSVWDDLQPEILSPRTLSLKCLEMMVLQDRKLGLTGDFVSKDLTSDLFAILGSASDVRCWDLPKGKLAIDFHLALVILESHSLVPRTSRENAIWISEYLPIMASTLEIALKKPIDSFGKLQEVLLKLTLDMAINDPDTCEVFAKSSLLSAMARAAVVIFKKILPLTDEDPAVVLLLSHLVLILAAMWNFAECTSTAGEQLESLQGQDDDPLGAMINIFTENREKISMVCLHSSSILISTNIHGRRILWRKL